jgi:hypothetical protein
MFQPSNKQSYIFAHVASHFGATWQLLISANDLPTYLFSLNNCLPTYLPRLDIYLSR